MSREIIKITNGVVRMPEWRMVEPINFTLNEGEHLAIVGPNASGKSMFVDILTSTHPLFADQIKYDFASTSKLVSSNIKYITFRDSYGAYDGAYYLQQRWNQMEISADTPTVGRQLNEAYALAGQDTDERRALKEHLYDLFSVRPLLDKFIVLLSSGEMRKFQLTKVLLSNPRILIIDNPFIGLDAETRDQLKTLLDTLSKEQQLQIIIVMSKSDDIPEFITHVQEVKDMRLLPKKTREEYVTNTDTQATNILSDEKRKAIISLPYRNKDYAAENVVSMKDVCISYGERTILDKLTWNVRNGECWALSGQNGAGKSTLLSLVCADNPQSYACDITLFDKKRGSGESIWDIKKHIGYVSPEMHRAYQRDMPAIRIVASGLKDSIGLYVKPNEAEYDICRWWMDILGISHLADRTFLKLSSGEQRLVLLARAFVKDPELLILDEPLHGLDNTNGELVKEIIDAFCQRQGKTLIMVTHYKEELPPCIDHSLFLKKRETGVCADYIKEIEIDSLWEGHKHIKWQLDPKINILSGINGVGKSTILKRMVSGIKSIDDARKEGIKIILHPANASRVRFDFISTPDVRSEYDDNLNILLDQYAMYANVEQKDKLSDIIDKLFAPSEKSVCRSSNMLELKQYDHILDMRLLSSGEKQILTILLTILLQDGLPTVLFLDEPEVSLHFEWQKELITIIRELNPHAQVILTTHSPAIVMNGWMDCITEVTDITID